MNRLLWFTLGGIAALTARAIIIALQAEPQLPPELEKILKTSIDLPEFESQTIEASEGDHNA